MKKIMTLLKNLFGNKFFFPLLNTMLIVALLVIVIKQKNTINALSYQVNDMEGQISSDENDPFDEGNNLKSRIDDIDSKIDDMDSKLDQIDSDVDGVRRTVITWSN